MCTPRRGSLNTFSRACSNFTVISGLRVRVERARPGRRAEVRLQEFGDVLRLERRLEVLDLHLRQRVPLGAVNQPVARKTAPLERHLRERGRGRHSDQLVVDRLPVLVDLLHVEVVVVLVAEVPEEIRTLPIVEGEGAVRLEVPLQASRCSAFLVGQIQNRDPDGLDVAAGLVDLHGVGRACLGSP